MQHLDAHPEYGLGRALNLDHHEIWKYNFQRLEKVVIPNIQSLLIASRRGRMRVIYLTIGPELSDGADLVTLRRPSIAPGLRPLFHVKGSKEHSILPALQPRAGELIVNKTSRGAFNSTAIERTLLNLRVETLFVTGVATGTCVDLTARDAADRGFYVVIVEDAVADLYEPAHEAALLQFAMRWGWVWRTREALDAIGRDTPPDHAGIGGVDD
jgi:nicotinamidase-related amidase